MGVGVGAMFSMRKPCFGSPKRWNIESESITRWPGNKPGTKQTNNDFEFKKTFIITSRSHSQIDNNPVICGLGSILLLDPPWWPRNATMASQGAPEVLNWLPRMSKWTQ